ncbi:breast cancer metastasis-suppressor 1 isoform X3 [Paramormyrops kingsleyae]|uniref:breast cancer metastasis-suppressor 1 isoform X3 n=1 Tax=Paramormyrops kingsleyae TaxID=1676925 RepID=UPI003B96FB23
MRTTREGNWSAWMRCRIWRSSSWSLKKSKRDREAVPGEVKPGEAEAGRGVGRPRRGVQRATGRLAAEHAAAHRGVYKELCLQVIKHKYDCELQGAQQHLESERSLLLDTMKTELLDQIHRLEEERQSRDISSEWWSDELKGKKCRRRSHTARPERRKKAALVSGPYIVYMLKDVDILEDWTAIKKAKAAVLPLKKKSENRQQYGARCQGGTLYYEGERFCKGNTILLHVKEDSTSQSVPLSLRISLSLRPSPSLLLSPAPCWHVIISPAACFKLNDTKDCSCAVPDNTNMVEIHRAADAGFPDDGGATLTQNGSVAPF